MPLGPRRHCAHISTAAYIQLNTTLLTIPFDLLWCKPMPGFTTSNDCLVQIGGYNDEERRVRFFEFCPDCDWNEIEYGLAVLLWYSANDILADGREIIIGDRGQFNYEFYLKTESTQNVYNFPFLLKTYDPYVENNLYPFAFLNVNGNLFIFANNRDILLDYITNNVVKMYPQILVGNQGLIYEPVQRFCCH
ncbi:putative galactose oxidase, beta-propeller [Rosa chinensis]|uniref:Putative galactose oxidase, beta-propeller n=1 Tax=Rosa chinensis TaxID=74649 RepID=A0A2P6PZ16_ROSCH|nr:putative galactose oxidase, beta-propeller [Rosa chinensis]